MVVSGHQKLWLPKHSQWSPGVDGCPTFSQADTLPWFQQQNFNGCFMLPPHAPMTIKPVFNFVTWCVGGGACGHEFFFFRTAQLHPRLLRQNPKSLRGKVLLGMNFIKAPKPTLFTLHVQDTLPSRGHTQEDRTVHKGTQHCAKQAERTGTKARWYERVRAHNRSLEPSG